MKWVVYFDAPVETAGYRYLSLRIRGSWTVAAADYAVAVLGDAAGGGMDYTVLAPSSAAVTGPRWRRLDLPLPPATKHPRLVGLAVQAQVHAADGAGEDVALLGTIGQSHRQLAHRAEHAHRARAHEVIIEHLGARLGVERRDVGAPRDHLQASPDISYSARERISTLRFRFPYPGYGKTAQEHWPGGKAIRCVVP
jgi:hypothetical protein